MFVYVINKNGNPLMPCTPAKAKHLLKAGKAKVISNEPFTIKLLWDCEEHTQEITAGMDTGTKTIGCAAITSDKVIYQSEIGIRQDVSRKMTQRKAYRRSRRGRKLRYRKPRFLNRASMRREGRLAPSIRSKVDSHLRERNFVESILPVTRWKVELASFDINKITNSDVKGKDYQQGPQKDYYNTKAYILHRDNYQCQNKKCKNKKKNIKLHVHHIIPRAAGGTNIPSNLIVICEDCHYDLHQGKFKIEGNRSKTKHATEMGIVKSQLEKQFGDFTKTYGYETKFKREKVLQLPKSHINDAIAICCEDGELVTPDNIIYFKKHVPSGDYKQTNGRRSERTIPTGKLFGLRKFDLVQTSKGIGFVRGKRSTGFFKITDLDWNVIGAAINIKKNCKRLSASSTTLIKRRHYV